MSPSGSLPVAVSVQLWPTSHGGRVARGRHGRRPVGRRGRRRRAARGRWRRRRHVDAHARMDSRGAPASRNSRRTGSLSVLKPSRLLRRHVPAHAAADEEAVRALPGDARRRAREVLHRPRRAATSCPSAATSRAGDASPRRRSARAPFSSNTPRSGLRDGKRGADAPAERAARSIEAVRRAAELVAGIARHIDSAAAPCSTITSTRKSGAPVDARPRRRRSAVLNSPRMRPPPASVGTRDRRLTLAPT